MNHRRSRRGQRGQMVPIFAMVSVVLFSFIGLGLDVGHNVLFQRHMQLAGDAAALGGAYQLVGSGGTLPTAAPAVGGSAVKLALQQASLNGFPTATATSGGLAAFCATPKNAGSSQLDYIFYASATSCAAPNPTVDHIEIAVPPIVPITGDCTAAPFSCMEVDMHVRVRNYIEGIIGQGYTYVSTTSVAYNKTASSAITLPPKNAVILYPPKVLRYNPTIPPLSALQPARPTFYNTAEGDIDGIDGNLQGAAADSTALVVGGDMVVGAPESVCDPYGGPAPGNGAFCSSSGVPGSGGSYVVGADGFSANSTLVPPASVYCQPAIGSNATCISSPAPAGVTVSLLNSNQTAYGPSPPNPPINPPSWTPSITQSGPSCGALILNGDTVQNSLTASGGNPACAVSGSYNVQPGTYSYIVVNHGSYSFGAGVYTITGSAPICGVACATPTSTGLANGIDHRGEATDTNLCEANRTNSCLKTAGVWFGHGLSAAGDFVPGNLPAVASCTAPKIGGIDGGDDQSNIQALGVTFQFKAAAGGFVSSNEVAHINMTAPTIGSSVATAGVPILFDLENNNFIHLDGAPQNSSDTSANSFRGLIYQTTSATGGGVEADTDIGKYKQPVVIGQIMAYSLYEFGQLPGITDDFHTGYGAPIATYPTAGYYETESLTSPVLTVGGGYDTLSVQFNDETMLDAYEIYVSVDGGAPNFFSKDLWYSGYTGNVPPEPNGSGPSYKVPSYNTISLPPGYTTLGSGTVQEQVGTDPQEWLQVSGTAGASGSWAWGSQVHFTPPGDIISIKSNTISFHLKTPAEPVTKFTVYLVDGDESDGCQGDYVIADMAFYNATGNPAPIPGAVELEK